MKQGWFPEKYSNSFVKKGTMPAMKLAVKKLAMVKKAIEEVGKAEDSISVSSGRRKVEELRRLRNASDKMYDWLAEMKKILVDIQDSAKSQLEFINNAFN